jgi:hypothetical protein
MRRVGRTPDPDPRGYEARRRDRLSYPGAHRVASLAQREYDEAGDVILLYAIGGGVGLFATQLAVRAGATVIGTVGTKGKEARALAYGATKVVNREDVDFVEAVTNFTEGRGVDKVLDSTGASILDRSLPTSAAWPSSGLQKWRASPNLLAAGHRGAPLARRPFCGSGA